MHAKCSEIQKSEIGRDKTKPNISLPYIDFECTCPVLNCTDLPDAIVCGTNEVQYRTECDLKNISCHNKLNVSKHFNGKCGK